MYGLDAVSTTPGLIGIDGSPMERLGITQKHLKQEKSKTIGEYGTSASVVGPAEWSAVVCYWTSVWMGQSSRCLFGAKQL